MSNMGVHPRMRTPAAALVLADRRTKAQIALARRTRDRSCFHQHHKTTACYASGGSDLEPNPRADLLPKAKKKVQSCVSKSHSYLLIIRSTPAMVELEGREFTKHHQHQHMRNRRRCYLAEPRQRHRSRLPQQSPTLSGVTIIAAAVGMVGFSLSLTQVEGFLSCPSIREASLTKLMPRRPFAVGIRRARGWSKGRTIVSSVRVVPYGTGRDVSEVAAASLGAAVRPDFPILHQEAYPDKPLVYLDNAATSQKPRAVVEAVRSYYEQDNANVHRGAHQLSVRATEAYEMAREKVAAFVNAETSREIVFTRGATEAINLVAQTWGLDNIGEGDEIVMTVMEHHSNMVPWQILAERKKAVIKFAQIRTDMSLDVEHMKSIITNKTKLVTMVHASNALGCVNPVQEIAAAARAVGARVLIDGCQSVPNMPVDVQTLGADWLVASGHKMCGPTGIGFLWGKMDVLKSMPPWQGGGEMIDQVFFSHSTYAEPPARFEAGTPAIAQAVGLGAACDYLSAIGMDKIAAYEHEMSLYLWQRVSEIEGLELYGPPPNAAGDNRNPLVAFNSRDVHAHDLSFFLDQEGVAIRAGHHCTQALHRQLGAAGSLRASLYLYNTKDDVDRFVEALKSTLEMFKGMGSGASGSGSGVVEGLLGGEIPSLQDDHASATRPAD